jgi:chitodextrinase
MRTYLKFTVAGVAGRTVLSAKLRLYCTDDASVFGGEVHRVPDTTWSETAITWNTAPPPDAAIISSFGSVALATWYEVDVTSAISGDGVVSLAATSTNADGAHYASRETGANAPQLVVTTSAAAPDTTPPSQPGSLLVSGRTATSLTLGWTASTDNVGVDHYEVARDGTVLGNTVSTGYTDTGLAPSSLHHYAVVAVDAAGNRSSAALVDGTTAPDTTPPTAPTGLTLVGATATQVSLSWTAATDDVGVTGYRVFRNGVLLGTSATTSYTDATVTGSTSYSYTVRAVDAAGNVSLDSAALSVTTPAAPDTTPPTAPTGLTAPSVTPTQVQLTWNAATDNVGVTGYRIYRGGVRIGTSTTTGYTDATVAAATTYSYTVTAVDAAANESVPSAALSVTTPAAPDTTPPTQPGGLVVSATTATSVSLRWTASTDNVGVHHYEVSRDSGAPASTTATAYTDSGLTPNTLYRYSVVAVDAAGNRSTAALVNGTTAPDTTPPTAPTGLAAAGVTATQVPLRWVAATDDVGVTGYRVYRNGLLLGTSATTSYTDLTVSAATSYTYTVSALDAAGNESPQSSPPLTVTTPAAGGQVLFSDGFETGNMSKWTLVNGVAAQQALVFSGLWGARMTSTTGATYAYGTLAAPATDVTYSLQFNIASQGANNINLLRLRNPSNGSLGAVYVTGSDLLSLRNDSASVSTTSTVVVSQGAWHTLRVHFVVGGVTASLEEVWLDGVKVDALTRTDTLGTTPIGTVQLGESSTARTYDVAYDDVRVTSP